MDYFNQKNEDQNKNFMSNNQNNENIVNKKMTFFRKLDIKKPTNFLSWIVFLLALVFSVLFI